MPGVPRAARGGFARRCEGTPPPSAWGRRWLGSCGGTGGGTSPVGRGLGAFRSWGGERCSFPTPGGGTGGGRGAARRVVRLTGGRRPRRSPAEAKYNFTPQEDGTARRP